MRLVEKYKNLVKSTDDADQKIKALENTKFRLSEALSTPDASIIMPRVISDVMRDAAEATYIGAKLLKEVQITDGRTIEFPSMSAIRAHDVAEGQEIPEETIDFQLHQTTEVKVGKVGVRISVTDEMISDSQWDVIGIMLQKAGHAMGRHKEEKIFNEFTAHGHTVFDVEHADPKFHPTGYGRNAQPNMTMSVEDMVDMVIALMANGYTATDVLMHPLVWTIMAKNEFISTLPMSALGSEGNNSIQLNPNAVGGRLPFAMNLQFTPFIPFNRADKKFDMYVIDRNEIGILLTKEGIVTDQWDNPARDIRHIKVRERYGVGILNEGKAISVAKNINFAKSYPYPESFISIDAASL